MSGQRFVYIGAHAVDLDVQLILCPGSRRVDGQADPVAGQCTPGTLFDEGAGAPRRSEVVRRIGGDDLRTLDSVDALGGNQQELRRADQVFEHRIAAGFAAVQIDECTARGIVIGPLIGYALAVHDVPQRTRVGSGHRCAARDRQHGDDRDRSAAQPGVRKCGHAGSQPRGD